MGSAATLTAYPKISEDEKSALTETGIRNYNPKDIRDVIATTAISVGTIALFPTTSAPDGYLKANGAAISRSTYNDLFYI